VVKGINFVGLKDVGDPVQCAMEYNKQGADEVVFLDIMASHEGRGTMAEVVRKTAEQVFIPLTVGGGIRTVDDFKELLRAGADKISINSAAVYTPSLISEAAERFGNQCVVVAIDSRRVRDSRLRGNDKQCGNDKQGWNCKEAVGDKVVAGGKDTGSVIHSSVIPAKAGISADNSHAGSGFNVYTEGGRKDTGLDVVMWARKVEKLGAGEILLTSMDTDGTKKGFDHEVLNAVCAAVDIPVIASGGGGSLESFAEVFEQTPADAALAASIFHYGEYTVDDVKDTLEKRGIPVRKVTRHSGLVPESQ
jgi:cyclase